jgi:3-isopropylmalate dehydrogenase
VSIVCLPGDGIGPEVMAAARKVLAVLAPDLELEERLFEGVDAAMTETPTQDLGGTATTDEFTAFVIGKLDR